MSAEREYGTLLVELEENVATVTLNRPERLNAFNEEMVADVDHLWSWVRDDDDVHAVVLRAAGDRGFCAGVDAREGPWWQEQAVFRQEDPGNVLGAKAQHVWKPVIVAVHGIAAGGAMYFLNEADIVIASEDAVFFDPHQSAGLVSALEPIGMLQRGVPLGDVLRWALTGNDERITAQTALRLGIVTEVVARDELWPAAGRLAREIAARRPDAVQGTVRAIWEALDVPPSIARQRGLAYTQLGNGAQAPDLSIPRVTPRYR